MTRDPDHKDGLPEGFLTPQELARHLRKTVVTLERWRNEGKGPPYYDLEPGILYATVDVRQYLDERRHEPPSRSND